MPSISLNMTATYDGMSIKRDGVVAFKFRVPTSDLANVVQSVLLVNKKFAVKVDGKAVGVAMFERMSIDREGETVLTVSSAIASLRVTLDVMRAWVDQTVDLSLAA